MIIKQADVYVITGKSFYYAAHNHTRYYYLNYNVLSKAQNPMVVTDQGHNAAQQVYFQSERQAKEFLMKFISAKEDRLDYDLKVIKYKGTYQDSTLVPVQTKYGKAFTVEHF